MIEYHLTSNIDNVLHYFTLYYDREDKTSTILIGNNGRDQPVGVINLTNTDHMYIVDNIDIVIKQSDVVLKVYGSKQNQQLMITQVRKHVYALMLFDQKHQCHVQYFNANQLNTIINFLKDITSDQYVSTKRK